MPDCIYDSVSVGIDVAGEAHVLTVCPNKTVMAPTQARGRELLLALLDDDVATAVQPFPNGETFWQLNLDIHIKANTSDFKIHLDVIDIHCDFIESIVACSPELSNVASPLMECSHSGVIENDNYHSCKLSCVNGSGSSNIRLILMFHYFGWEGIDKNETKFLNFNLVWLRIYNNI